MTTQEQVLNELKKRGFKISHSHPEFPGSDDMVYHLHKKTMTGRIYATVDPNGMVNGEDLTAYYGIIENKIQ